MDIYFLAMYMSKGYVTPGTMIDRIIQCGLSPISCALNKLYVPNVSQPNGLVDSLRQLICHEKFYSEEHVLARLLTRAF